MYNFVKRPRLEEDNSSSQNSEIPATSPLSTFCCELAIPSSEVLTDPYEVEMMSAAAADQPQESQVTSIKLPYFGIQCDWDDTLNNHEAKAWISVRQPGQQQSVHGHLQKKGSDIVGSDSFQVLKSKTTKHSISVRDDNSGDECSFVAPITVFNGVHKKSIVSMDVSEGGLGVSVCQNNELKIWETETGNVRRELSGHVADIYSCRFFPSGVVVLSAGADMSLKIWSAETGDCPVTLRGHSAAITDTCIVDRGRNIISVSKDGTAKLWDVGESKCLATLVNCGVQFTSCTLIPPSSNVIDIGNPVPNLSEREIGTQGKLLLLAREDSKIQGIGVGSRKEIFTLHLPSPANKIIANGSNSFLVGCQNGQIQLVDLRKIVPISKSISFATGTPILDLVCHPRSPSSKPGVDESNRFFWATKSDGTVTIVNPNVKDNSRKYVQLTGSDCDPIYQVKHDGNYIFTACRDGLIRKYSIDHIMKVY